MKVKFVPQNVEFEIKPGESVMHVAQDNGLYVKSVCKGVPSCAECRVRVIEGEHNVLPPGSEELALIGTGHFIDRRRLSCQLKCFGDITVDMTEQLEKQKSFDDGRKQKKTSVQDDRVEEESPIRSGYLEDDTESKMSVRTVEDEVEEEGRKIPTSPEAEEAVMSQVARENRRDSGRTPGRSGPQPGRQNAQGADGSSSPHPKRRRRRKRGGGGGGGGKGPGRPQPTSPDSRRS